MITSTRRRPDPEDRQPTPRGLGDHVPQFLLRRTRVPVSETCVRCSRYSGLTVRPAAERTRATAASFAGSKRCRPRCGLARRQRFHPQIETRPPAPRPAAAPIAHRPIAGRCGARSAATPPAHARGPRRLSATSPLATTRLTSPIAKASRHPLPVPSGSCPGPVQGRPGAANAPSRRRSTAPRSGARRRRTPRPPQQSSDRTRAPVPVHPPPHARKPQQSPASPAPVASAPSARRVLSCP